MDRLAPCIRPGILWHISEADDHGVPVVGDRTGEGNLERRERDLRGRMASIEESQQHVIQSQHLPKQIQTSSEPPQYPPRPRTDIAIRSSEIRAQCHRREEGRYHLAGEEREDERGELWENRTRGQDRIST